MTSLTEEQRKEIAEKYPTGVVFTETKLGTAAFKCPDRTQWKKHLGMVNQSNTLADGAEFLARACVVHPTREVFDQWLEEQPGIPSQAVKKIQKLAGAEEESTGEG